MDLRIDFTGLFCFLLICFSTATSFIHCEARSSGESQNSLGFQAVELEVSKRLDIYSSSDLDYVGSPFSLPPFGDGMGPTTSPDENPPYCVYPPLIPLPPSTPLPTPITPIQPSQPPPPPPTPPPPISTIPPVIPPNPPAYPTPPSPPQAAPSPPELVPSPPIYFPGPPSGIVPSPPYFGPSPPSYVPTPPPTVVPSPPVFAPGPPIFLPPVVYPPPTGPAPPPGGAPRGLWCVAKPTVPDPIIQEAMNYACGSGADCDSIQPSGSCYQPDTLLAHASFAFNSYWQRTKVAGGTCDFGGSAMLVTKDPSYDGCRFNIN